MTSIIAPSRYSLTVHDRPAHRETAARQDELHACLYLAAMQNGSMYWKAMQRGVMYMAGTVGRARYGQALV
jgi:hypothetical protein